MLASLPEDKKLNEEKAAQLECWAIVELFGHNRIAGRVKSENFGSACLIRVDVPEVEKQAPRTYDYEKGEYIPGHRVRVAAFTKYLGLGSIYALNPVTEELARAAAAEIGCEPVRAFGLESVKRLANKALPEGPDDAVEEEDIEEDEIEAEAG